MEEIVKNYTNGEVTIVWKPALCTHAKHCFMELPEVFNPESRPWINPAGASTERIIQQIKRCPSGALGYFMNNESQEKKQNINSEMEVEVVHNGPLVIKVPFLLKAEGKADEHKPDGAAFCRCGKSRNQPFCDGSHMENPFEK